MKKRFVQISNNTLLVCIGRCSDIKKSAVLSSICELSVASILIPSGCVVQAEILLARVETYCALFPGGCVTSHPAVSQGPHSGGACWATGASREPSLQTLRVQKPRGGSVALIVRSGGDGCCLLCPFAVLGHGLLRRWRFTDPAQ